MEIEWLFDKFAACWDEQWTRKMLGSVAQVAEKKKIWARQIKNRTRSELTIALNAAFELFDSPPSPANFIKLLPPRQKTQEVMDYPAAVDIADRKTQKLVGRNFDEVLMIREIFSQLATKIFETRNPRCDFAVCSVQDCRRFGIFDDFAPMGWKCVQHKL